MFYTSKWKGQKVMKHQKARKIALTTALGIGLAAGVSFYPLMRHLINEKTQDFDKIEITIGKERYSKQKFYENLKYKEGAWRLQKNDGTFVNIDSLADFRMKDKFNHEILLKQKLTERVDTVYARYANGHQTNYLSDIVYGMGAQDSLGYLPAFGRYDYGRINVRYFKADNEELQKVVDVFNDKYNCTHRHEYQHYLNALAGIGRAGQSYEVKFIECCLDEVSANIAQLLEQRKNYLENGKDESYITSRFRFYREALANGLVAPGKEEISSKEAAFIANGVFDNWMKDKFKLYVHNNFSRTRHILSKTNYNGVLPDSLRHRQLMEKCFNINGVDFYPYIAEREDEVRQKIPQDKLRSFLLLKKEKYKQMGYIEKLENQRITQGQDKYDKDMLKNAFLARARRALNLGRR